MDVDKKKVFGMVGGCTIKEQGQGLYNPALKKKGIVSAFTFNKDLKIVAYIELPAEKCSCVGSIVYSPSHEDIVFTATDGPLFILGLDVVDRKFHIVKAVNFQNKGFFFINFYSVD